MSLIHIARNNVVLGQFSETEIGAGLQSGLYFPTDLAWKSGMAQWRPLSAWPEFGGSAPLTPPDTFATAPGEIMPAWERRKDMGLFTAFIETTKHVLRYPDITFRNMPVTGGIGGPLTYYVIPQILLGGVISLTMAILIGFIMSTTASGTSSSLPIPSQAFAGLGAAGIGIAYFLFFTIMAPITVFVMAGFTHLMLMAWGACRAPFEATFRVVAYTSGAMAVVALPGQLFSLIPCVGYLISLAIMALWVWVIIVQIKGLSIVHGSTQGRVIGAVLTPILVCCCGAGLLWAALIGAMMNKVH